MSGTGAAPRLLDLPLFRRGKVRDTYDLGDCLLMVASDRVSAFDVVLPTPIPGKGIVLNGLSRFWFERTRHLVPNHLVSADPSELPARLRAVAADLAGRAMLVRKAERLDIECVVRGYLAGSAWLEYQATGAVAGESIGTGFQAAQRLPEPMFTPAIKHDLGHDMNISRAALDGVVGADLANRLARASLALYGYASEAAAERGLILADTKFEFGFVEGELTLIDEAVTPDSSRFWDAASYRLGSEPASFDKQNLRDWLVRSGWNKQPPGPSLPDDVVAATVSRYREAYRRLTGQDIGPYPLKE